MKTHSNRRIHHKKNRKNKKMPYRFIYKIWIRIVEFGVLFFAMFWTVEGLARDDSLVIDHADEPVLMERLSLLREVIETKDPDRTIASLNISRDAPVKRDRGQHNKSERYLSIDKTKNGKSIYYNLGRFQFNDYLCEIFSDSIKKNPFYAPPIAEVFRFSLF